MSNIESMIEAATDEDKDSFVNYFVREAVRKINEKLDFRKKEISKNLLNPDGVWNEFQEDENVSEEISDVIETRNQILASSLRSYDFLTIEEAKLIRRKIKNSAGICEECVKQRGNKLFVEDTNDMDQLSRIYAILKENTEIVYDPFFEFADVLREAIENEEVLFTLADTSEVVINSKLAQQIAQVHDTLTRENQQIFKNNLTLNENSFNSMVKFVESVIENLEEEEEEE